MAYSRNTEDRDTPGYRESSSKPLFDRVHKRPRSSGSSSSSGSSIFGWILLIMIAINIPRFITGGGFNWSFQELIETLAGAPSIDISQLATVFEKITANWGAFNFLRDFLNLFVDLGSALVFLGAGMVQIIAYVLYFLGKLFGF